MERFCLHSGGMAPERVEDVGGAGEVEDQGSGAVVSCSRRLQSEKSIDSPECEFIRS
jgi:hypothetical protein